MSAFGTAYEESRHRVPMLVPRWRGRAVASPVLKKAGAASVLFFLAKGLSWLVIPALVSLAG